MFEELKLNPEHKVESDFFRCLYYDLAENMLAKLDNTRERSVAMTKLEESFDWIQKAIANDRTP